MSSLFPSLDELPRAAPGLTGWPWSNPSNPDLLLTLASEGLPRISVVTPSFNQAQFLEQTIRSVLLQGYPNLEYIVVDGGSTDGSVEILKRYSPWLTWWVSERDRGQVDAINKGLQRATGDWVGWQNSDDLYCPGALEDVARAIQADPRAALVVGNVNLIDAEGQVLTDLLYVRPTYRSMLAEGMVMTNQASFWRRDLHASIGWLDDTYPLGFDYEWFLRVLQAGSARHVDRTLGAYRIHADAKTARFLEQSGRERARILAGRSLPRWAVQAYRLRRLALLLAHGHLRYVIRALMRRAAGVRKDLL